MYGCIVVIAANTLLVCDVEKACFFHETHGDILYYIHHTETQVGLYGSQTPIPATHLPDHNPLLAAERPFNLVIIKL